MKHQPGAIDAAPPTGTGTGVARTRMSGAQRREQLVEVGRGVFAARGFEAATVEEIAERAGVSKPVVYEHFGGKEALYAEVVRREVTRLTDGLAEALRVDDPRELAEGAARAFLGYIEEHEQGFRILLRDAPVDRADPGPLSSLLGDVAAAVEHLVAAEFIDRGLDPGEAPMVSRLLVGAVAQVGEWWLDVRRPERDEVARRIAELLWFGLRGLRPR